MARDACKSYRRAEIAAVTVLTSRTGGLVAGRTWQTVSVLAPVLGDGLALGDALPLGDALARGDALALGVRLRLKMCSAAAAAP